MDKPEQDIANIASFIADKSRAGILMALMSHKALTAGELALANNISAQATSNHLKKLMASKLIACESVGRHRYYRLSSHLVASAIESLGLLSKKPEANTSLQRLPQKNLCFARSCYDHLAGELSILIKELLLTKNFIAIENKNFRVTEKGSLFFKNKMDIDINALKLKRRPLCKACLDWTQREHHIAGALGSALLNHFIEQRLVIRSKSQARVLHLTEKGKLWLKELEQHKC